MNDQKMMNAEDIKALVGELISQTPKEKSVPNLDEERDAVMQKTLKEIDALRKKEGMMVFELIQDKYHQHVRGISTYTDDKTGMRFKIRNNNTFDNPFIEYQDGDVEVRDDIHFQGKMLIVNSNDLGLFRFLMLHPWNERNGGKVFRVRDIKKQRLAKFEFGEKQYEAYAYVKTLEESQQRAALLYLSENKRYKEVEDLETNELLAELKELCDNEPYNVLELEHNPRVEYTYVYSVAESVGLIYHDPQAGLIRHRNKIKIVECTSDTSPSLRFADWVTENAGGKAKNTYESIKKKIGQ